MHERKNNIYFEVPQTAATTQTSGWKEHLQIILTLAVLIHFGQVFVEFFLGL